MKATCGLFKSQVAVFMPFVSDAFFPPLIAVAYSLKRPALFLSSALVPLNMWNGECRRVRR
jgi:hypothetical protein